MKVFDRIVASRLALAGSWASRHCCEAGPDDRSRQCLDLSHRRVPPRRESCFDPGPHVILFGAPGRFKVAVPRRKFDWVNVAEVDADATAGGPRIVFPERGHPLASSCRGVTAAGGIVV